MNVKPGTFADKAHKLIQAQGPIDQKTMQAHLMLPRRSDVHGVLARARRLGLLDYVDGHWVLHDPSTPAKPRPRRRPLSTSTGDYVPRYGSLPYKAISILRETPLMDSACLAEAVGCTDKQLRVSLALARSIGAIKFELGHWSLAPIT